MSAKSKGNAFERRWAEMLRDSGCDLAAKRNLEEVRESSVDIITQLPFGFQVRSGAGVSVWKCIGDAQTGSEIASKRWACGVVFETRPRRKQKGNPPFPPFIIMLLEEFVEFLEETPRGRRPEFEIIIHARRKKTSHYPAAKRLVRESVARRKESLEEAHEYFIFEIKERPTIIFTSALEYLQLLKIWAEERKQ